MAELSIGKIRGLQQIASDEGIFTMCAMDHRDSLKKMISHDDPDSVPSEEMTRRKFELCETLAPFSSAVLLDPIYGAAQAVSRGKLPRQTGLLVSIEATGYLGGEANRLTRLLDNWGVEKIKRLGAQAVKILIYYRSDSGEVAAKQLETVKGVAADCAKHDIPFLVENVSYATGNEKKDPAAFAARRPELVIQAAKDITALPVEVLKTEFPADARFEKDMGRMADQCRRLNDASRLPWVLLSQGVSYEVFAVQVEIACRAGASGFLGGRAIWQEAFQLENAVERLRFLRTTGVDRLKRLDEIASKYAVPWYKKLGLSPDRLSSVDENWYQTY